MSLNTVRIGKLRLIQIIKVNVYIINENASVMKTVASLLTEGYSFQGKNLHSRKKICSLILTSHFLKVFEYLGGNVLSAKVHLTFCRIH